MTDVSLFRLYALRAGYLLTAVGVFSHYVRKPGDRWKRTAGVTLHSPLYTGPERARLPQARP